MTCYPCFMRRTTSSWLLVIAAILQLKPANGATNWTGPIFVKGSCLAFEEYPLVICYIAIENHHRSSEFSHEKWWFSIVMLNYQRVFANCGLIHQPSCDSPPATARLSGSTVELVLLTLAMARRSLGFVGSTEGISSWNRWRFGEYIYQTAWWFTQALQETSGAL